MESSVEIVVADLFRREAGKLTAILTRLFGMKNLELAEDVVQETLLKALQTWPYQGIPRKPSAWIMQVAKHKALDALRRERFQIKLPEDLSVRLESEWSLAATMNELFLESEIPDDLLRMIFTCCHPSLPFESQVALTLKTLGGFGVGEIARAFLTQEATIHKRLYRAKRSLIENGVALEIPAGTDLRPRLESVLTTLYLMFNEGYQSAHDERVIREELIAEAMRLTRLIVEHPVVASPQAEALLALMCFHTARVPARLDDSGNILLLESQDRSLWDKDLIARGEYWLNHSATGNEVSRYHLEAGIACLHAQSPTPEATPWPKILKLYDVLYGQQPSPVVALNRAVAMSRVQGYDTGLNLLLTLKEDLEDYYLYHAILADAYGKLGIPDHARAYYRQAIVLCTSAAERRLLVSKLGRLNELKIKNAGA